MNSVQQKDVCGSYGDHDDSDLVIVTAWQRAWRLEISRVLSTAALKALRNALQQDDPNLLQGATTSLPPLQAVQAWPVEKACALCYGGWQGEGQETVGEIELYFVQVCYEADQHLGKPSACRYFLNWFDETPRDEMRRQLLCEVEWALAQREAVAA